MKCEAVRLVEADTVAFDDCVVEEHDKEVFFFCESECWCRVCCGCVGVCQQSLEHLQVRFHQNGRLEQKRAIGMRTQVFHRTGGKPPTLDACWKWGQVRSERARTHNVQCVPSHKIHHHAAEVGPTRLFQDLGRPGLSLAFFEIF